MTLPDELNNTNLNNNPSAYMQRLSVGYLANKRRRERQGEGREGDQNTDLCCEQDRLVKINVTIIKCNKVVLPTAFFILM